MHRRSGLIALVVLLATGLACRPAAEPQSAAGAAPVPPRAVKPAGPSVTAGESFAGKTVTLSVNYSPGGPPTC